MTSLFIHIFLQFSFSMDFCRVIGWEKMIIIFIIKSTINLTFVMIPCKIYMVIFLLYFAIHH